MQDFSAPAKLGRVMKAEALCCASPNSTPHTLRILLCMWSCVYTFCCICLFLDSSFILCERCAV